MRFGQGFVYLACACATTILLAAIHAAQHSDTGPGPGCIIKGPHLICVVQEQ